MPAKKSRGSEDRIPLVPPRTLETQIEDGRAKTNTGSPVPRPGAMLPAYPYKEAYSPALCATEEQERGVSEARAPGSPFVQAEETLVYDPLGQKVERYRAYIKSAPNVLSPQFSEGSYTAGPRVDENLHDPSPHTKSLRTNFRNSAAKYWDGVR